MIADKNMILLRGIDTVLAAKVREDVRELESEINTHKIKLLTINPDKNDTKN